MILFNLLLGFRHLVRSASFGVALFGFAGCVKQQDQHATFPAPSSKAPALKIGISFQELDNPYFAVMKQAFDEAGQSIGAELYATDARHDVTKQINDVE